MTQNDVSRFGPIRDMVAAGRVHDQQKLGRPVTLQRLSDGTRLQVDHKGNAPVIVREIGLLAENSKSHTLSEVSEQATI